MAEVHFTSHLQRFVNCESVAADGATVGEVLGAVFAQNEPLRSYVLDDQGRLRRHVMVFVDGQTITDRLGLSDALKPDSEVYVMQALSGG